MKFLVLFLFSFQAWADNPVISNNPVLIQDPVTGAVVTTTNLGGGHIGLDTSGGGGGGGGGTVTANQGTANVNPWPVSITSYPASPQTVNQGSPPWSVSQSGVWTNTVTQSSGANLHANVDNFPATQPVSGTVTANQGGAPWSVTGSGIFTVVQPTGANLHATVDNFPATQVVSGTVTSNQGTSPWVNNVTQFGGNNVATGVGASGVGIPRVTVANDSNILATQSGSWAVTANAGTNLNTSALALDTSVNGVLNSQGSTTSGQKGPLIQGAVSTAAPSYTNAQTSPLSLTPAGAVRTDSSSVTQPVSGTVTANVGTTNGLALDSTASNLSAKFGSLGQKTSAGSAPVVLASDQSALPITGSITATNAANGAPGGATPSQATQVGGSDGAALRPLKVSTNGVLAVDNSGVTQPVSGAVTANQGLANANPWPVNITSYPAASANVNITSYPSPLNVVGTVSQGGAPWSVQQSGTFTVSQTIGTNLHVVVDSGTISPTAGLSSIFLIRNDYSSINVTTSAYVQLIASTTNTVNQLLIFDSSGQDLVLATGGAGSEVDQIQIPSGGWDLPVNLLIPSGSRVSVKAKSATASSGILLISGLK